MDPFLVGTVMRALILTYLLVGVVFIACRRQGEATLASFDNAVAFGCCAFIIGYGMDSIAYVSISLFPTDWT